MNETILPPPVETRTVCGIELPLRPFDNAQADQWARIYDARELDANQKRTVKLQTDIQNLGNPRIDLQQKAVDALNAKLDKHYDLDPDRWDEKEIARLSDRIVAETEKLRQMQAEDAERVLTESTRLAEALDDSAQAVQEAHLEMCHWLASDARTLEAWLSEATADDYRHAGEVVKAGQTPFLSRRQRRARKAGSATS